MDAVQSFLEKIEPIGMREDCQKLFDLMKETTKAEAKIWNKTMVGFGQYHYKYDSGREGDWFLVGFSPRKENLVVYLVGGFDEEILQDLGKLKVGSSCLYLKRLSDIDETKLSLLVKKSVMTLKKKFG